jgi:hypothetical protein
MLRSENSATSLLRIGAPRSVWIVSWCGPIPCVRQGAQLTRLLAGVGLREDAAPILRWEAPALDLRWHFRIEVARA